MSWAENTSDKLTLPSLTITSSWIIPTLLIISLSTATNSWSIVTHCVNWREKENAWHDEHDEKCCVWRHSDGGETSIGQWPGHAGRTSARTPAGYLTSRHTVVRNRLCIHGSATVIRRPTRIRVGSAVVRFVHSRTELCNCPARSVFPSVRRWQPDIRQHHG